MTVAMVGRIRRERLKSYPTPRRPSAAPKTKSAAPSGTGARTRRTKGDLVQVVRHVVERRVQLVADALHRANRRNGDQSSDETVLNGGRTLFIANQLQKLAHGLAPWFQD